jgi:imidazolonepropionase-like amidohydrolase
MSVLESMARHHVTWTPTLVVFEYFARSAEADAELAPTLRTAAEAEVAAWHRLRDVFAGSWGPTEIEMALRAIDRIQASLARYHALGGPIAAGSDLTFGGPSLIREVRLLTRAGLSPLEAIHAATGVAGSALGRGSELGILQPGSLADLIVLEDDPLSDLSALGRPSAVMIDGRVVLSELGEPGAI